jgi:hypothetical protein
MRDRSEVPLISPTLSLMTRNLLGKPELEEDVSPFSLVL